MAFLRLKLITSFNNSGNFANMYACDGISQVSNPVLLMATATHRQMAHLFLECDGISQVDGQLSDVEKGVLVGQPLLHQEHLHQGALHEVDQGQRCRRDKLAVVHVSHVHLLKQQSSIRWMRSTGEINSKLFTYTCSETDRHQAVMSVKQTCSSSHKPCRLIC